MCAEILFGLHKGVNKSFLDVFYEEFNFGNLVYNANDHYLS